MSKVRVMIVEDQPTYRELVEIVLSLDPQFDVVGVASDGQEALDSFDEVRPDLVLIDFLMPGLDGLETARRMKERRPEVKIAMVTAHEEEVLKRLASAARIQEVIPKASFNLDRVQRLVKAGV